MARRLSLTKGIGRDANNSDCDAEMLGNAGVGLNADQIEEGSQKDTDQRWGPRRCGVSRAPPGGHQDDRNGRNQKPVVICRR